MTVVTPARNTFSAGEIAPLLHRRIDFQRNQTGLARCRGFLPLREGGLTRAPGTEYLGTTSGDAKGRLIGFTFNAGDALQLEFTPGKMRVWRYGALVMAGGTPYELATPFDAASIAALNWVQSADVIYLADGRRPIQRLARMALDDWSIGTAPIRGGPFRVQNLDKDLTVTPSAVAGPVTLTASAPLFTADHIGTLMMIEPLDMTVPLWTTDTAVTVGDKLRNDGNTYELVTGTNTKGVPPVHLEGTERVCANPVIEWKFLDDGRGIVQIVAVTDATTALAVVVKRIPQDCVDNPSYRWSEAAWSDRYGWPAALALYDERLVAAATATEPRTLWFSTVGDYQDFTPGVEADESFAYTISGQDGLNPIRSLVRGGAALHILGLGEEHSTRSTSDGQAIGPTTAAIRFDGGRGASTARPIAPSGAPVFISRDKARLFQIRYSLEADAFRELELSITARHIAARGLEEIAWAEVPDATAWLRLGDGELAAMIWDEDQDVLGWSVLGLAGGAVESLCVTPCEDGSCDELHLIVRRTLGGVTRRCVERLSRPFAAREDDAPAWTAQHAFCARVFAPGGPTYSFSLPHLAGELVHAWTDQGPFGPLEVAVGGALTLPLAVGHAGIGLLDETAMAETLDLQAAAPEGSAMGRRKRVHAQTVVAVHRTVQGRLATVERNLGQPERVSPAQRLVPERVGATLNQPHSGLVRVPAPSGVAEEVALRFTPQALAPMTVTAVVPVIEEEGR